MTNFAAVTRLPEPIKTERLILRQPGMGDEAAIARLANNKNIQKWLSRMPHPYGHADAIHFIQNIARSDKEHAFAVVSRDEDFVGTMGFNMNDSDTPELGYWFGEPYWGEGYASEAAIALVAAADVAGVEKVVARAMADNRPSQRVLEKAGFQCVDERIDVCGQHANVLLRYYERGRTQ